MPAGLKDRVHNFVWQVSDSSVVWHSYYFRRKIKIKMGLRRKYFYPAQPGF